MTEHKFCLALENKVVPLSKARVSIVLLFQVAEIMVNPAGKFLGLIGMKTTFFEQNLNTIDKATARMFAVLRPLLVSAVQFAILKNSFRLAPSARRCTARAYCMYNDEKLYELRSPSYRLNVGYQSIQV